MLNKIFALGLVVSGLFYSGNAFAYRANHKTMSELRPVLGGDAYINQQIQYSEANSVLLGVDAKDSKNSLLQGYALRFAAGLEHKNMLQTGMYFSSNTANVRGGTHAELRTMEAGGEMKLVFSGPLANLCIGGGYGALQGNYRNGLEYASVSGTTYFGSAEIVYFLSSRLSFNMSANKAWTTHVVRGGTLSRITTEGLRAGAGFAIWL
jgi:hypothetical protein